MGILRNCAQKNKRFERISKMMEKPKRVLICRHGQTPWSINRQHTGTTNIELTAEGKEEAKRLGAALKAYTFDAVFCSPLIRAQQTCQLAGFSNFTTQPLLAEWDYGDYEGLTSKEIQNQVPGWNIFENGVPNGESLLDIENRAKRLLEEIQKIDGTVLLFSHGHFTRIFGGVWIGKGGIFGKYLTLSTAARCSLGWEHGCRVIQQWNVH